MTKIVTCGATYIDIDAYAGCIAYAELLNLLGFEARAISTGVLNESITPTVRSWEAPLQATYEPNPDDTFCIIDVSEPTRFDSFVDEDRVETIIDHHPGFEDYWRQRIGDNAIIELVGAACTQVYEEWVRASKLDEMSMTSARLLMCGILDNTLNFGAQITTDRDKTAYTALSKIAKLPENWIAQYFEECQTSIVRDPVTAVLNDVKTMGFRTYKQPIYIGQLTVWEAQPVLKSSQKAIATILSQHNPNWFANIISINEGVSYLLTDAPPMQRWLESLLGVTFDGPLAKADRMWLRKEIAKQDIDKVS